MAPAFTKAFALVDEDGDGKIDAKGLQRIFEAKPEQEL